MPLYEAECPHCGTRQDYFSKIDARLTTPSCVKCGGHTNKALTITMLPILPLAESMNVVSPIDGTVMRSRSDYFNHMKKHNVRPASDYEGVKKVEPTLDKEKLRQTISDAYDRHVGN